MLSTAQLRAAIAAELTQSLMAANAAPLAVCRDATSAGINASAQMLLDRSVGVSSRQWEAAVAAMVDAQVDLDAALHSAADPAAVDCAVDAWSQAVVTAIEEAGVPDQDTEVDAVTPRSDLPPKPQEDRRLAAEEARLAGSICAAVRAQLQVMGAPRSRLNASRRAADDLQRALQSASVAGADAVRLIEQAWAGYERAITEVVRASLEHGVESAFELVVSASKAAGAALDDAMKQAASADSASDGANAIVQAMANYRATVTGGAHVAALTVAGASDVQAEAAVSILATVGAAAR